MLWIIFNKYNSKKSVLCQNEKKCVILMDSRLKDLCSDFYALPLFVKNPYSQHVSHKSLFAKTFSRFQKLDKDFFVHF